jgi:hypothetical protein
MNAEKRALPHCKSSFTKIRLMAVRLVASQKQSFYLALPDERDSNKIEQYDVKASPIQYGMCLGWAHVYCTRRCRLGVRK